jgi:hypothetical protein
MAAVATMVTSAAATHAQQPRTVGPKEVTVSGGVAVATGYRIGDLTATWRRNTLGAPQPFTLLRAESELGRAVGFEGRVGVGLARAWAVEVGGSYSTADLGVTVSSDSEVADGAFASERVTQFVVDVSGLYQLPFPIGRRVRPYVLGGAGYLRQLHEGRVSVETGRTMHAGGGLQYWLHPGGRRRDGVGVRAEARYVRRSGGVEFEDRSRGFMQVSALGFYQF